MLVVALLWTVSRSILIGHRGCTPRGSPAAATPPCRATKLFVMPGPRQRGRPVPQPSRSAADQRCRASGISCVDDIEELPTGLAEGYRRHSLSYHTFTLDEVQSTVNRMVALIGTQDISHSVTLDCLKFQIELSTLDYEDDTRSRLDHHCCVQLFETSSFRGIPALCTSGTSYLRET